MEAIKQEIQSMYNYLTGNSYDEFELNQMSHRELRDLHSELYISHKEAIEDSIEMYIDLNY
jgi:hypothetical protein